MGEGRGARDGGRGARDEGRGTGGERRGRTRDGGRGTRDEGRGTGGEGRGAAFGRGYTVPLPQVAPLPPYPFSPPPNPPGRRHSRRRRAIAGGAGLWRLGYYPGELQPALQDRAQGARLLRSVPPGRQRQAKTRMRAAAAAVAAAAAACKARRERGGRPLAGIRVRVCFTGSPWPSRGARGAPGRSRASAQPGRRAAEGPRSVAVRQRERPRITIRAACRGRMRCGRLGYSRHGSGQGRVTRMRAGWQMFGADD